MLREFGCVCVCIYIFAYNTALGFNNDILKKALSKVVKFLQWHFQYSSLQNSMMAFIQLVFPSHN